jgi:hypothetical protein
MTISLAFFLSLAQHVLKFSLLEDARLILSAICETEFPCYYMVRQGYLMLDSITQRQVSLPETQAPSYFLNATQRHTRSEEYATQGRAITRNKINIKF